MNRTDILIEVDDLLKKLGNDDLRLYDATIVDDMYVQGHIPGAAYFDHEKFSDLKSPYEVTLSPETELEAQIGRAGIANASEVVVYACGMLPYAVRAWWVLKYAGHDNVRVLNGGITAWKAAGGPMEQEARQYAPTTFKANFRPSMFADKHAVLKAMGDSTIATVNVMPPVSYEGKRIVGSVNLNCMDLMQGLDYFLPDDQLALRLKEVTHHQRIITYCGGGIAATVNAAAHWMTGYENVAVYDGSLYEWLAEGLPSEGEGNWEIWKKPQA